MGTVLVRETDGRINEDCNKYGKNEVRKARN